MIDQEENRVSSLSLTLIAEKTLTRRSLAEDQHHLEDTGRTKPAEECDPRQKGKRRD
jgi:hypothetical protein